ncbi:MAG: TetR/AcrR family transcriptional regulator [Marmoricola sp.]|nr:TetR/AcrR family transcriptional regulator [Marmoricola sp.]
MTADVSTQTAQKPLRADAQRNYDNLIEAAREAFRERGAEASLDDIAKRAGVGPGTLYRHFPTRDALIDAMMRDWAERIDADSQAVVDSGLPAREALQIWFTRFVDNIGLYHGAAAKVMSAMDDPKSPIYRKCQVLAAANEKVVAKAREDGALRDGVDAREVMRIVSGVSTVIDQSGLTPAQAEPMLAIVLDGILLPD